MSTKPLSKLAPTSYVATVPLEPDRNSRTPPAFKVPALWRPMTLNARAVPAPLARVNTLLLASSVAAASARSEASPDSRMSASFAATLTPPSSQLVATEPLSARSVQSSNGFVP